MGCSTSFTLDVGVFSPFKNRVQELFNEAVQRGELITKTTAPRFMIQAWGEKATE